ncbi:hypothetical protein AL755_06230 [Arthrobacter sp. ERGS1:01]|uniref:hypothetical protein n=1 Tax=Arthrobacter sp. ERGS1:01 TaxID=1704044 RepID=UPI0006B58500|nr:hypothetical protein [Arthrobacter sp. ERGS1:01]ALE05171.1 hypothetical protein AL755_06230 [Arthrobacter sp. ERGS1:01]
MKAGTAPVSALRRVPGLKTALVAFVLVVILGSGSAAVANWQQSATATIAITAGAAPIAPAGNGTIVVSPVLAVRPSLLDSTSVRCASVLPQAQLDNAASADIKFTWPAATTTSAYVTTLTFEGNGYSYQRTQTVSAPSAVFTLQRTQASFGIYILRVQPMNGGTGGDPVYRTFKYAQNDSTNCYYANPAGRSPLGTPAITAQPVVRGTTTSTLPLSWTAAPGATSYVITVKSTTSSYGTEFTQGGLSATLTFPQAAADQFGNPAAKDGDKAPYYSDYLLRLQPMNGTTAGDPVYKTIRYYFWNSSVGDN